MSGAFTFGETNPIVGARSIRRTNLTLQVRGRLELPARIEAGVEIEGELSGSLRGPQYASPLASRAGTFAVQIAAGSPRRRTLHYGLTLAEGAEHLFLEGVKEIREEEGFDLWTDTTTLYVRLRAGESSGRPIVGAGILTLSAAEFTRVMSSVRVAGVEGAAERTREVQRFGKLYAGELWSRYISPVGP